MTTTKPRVALYDFMPYGAPELLESEREFLSRALIAGTLLVVATLAVLALVLPRVAMRGAPDLDRIHDVVRYVLPEPPPIPRFELPKAAPALPVAHTRGGSVVPVDDATADPAETLPSQAELSEPGAGTAADATGAGPIVLPSTSAEVDPTPETFVPVDEMPVLVRRVVPVYPDLAREAGVEGTVLVQAKVGKDGRVLEVRVQPGHSVPLLDEAALAAVKAWVFTPALTNRHPVVVWVRQPVVFRLH